MRIFPIGFYLALCATPAWSQALTPLPAGVPQLAYRVDPGWPELPEGWNLLATPDVAVDSEGHVYVFHRGPHPIIEMDAQGKFVRAWGDGLFVSPHGLRFDRAGNLWAADNGAHFVAKLDRRGRFTMFLGRHGVKGETDDLFNAPTDIGFASNGDFFVTDGYGNSRVVKFSKEGRFLKAWGKRGTAPGEFNTPHTVVVDKADRVYVGDRQNYRIQIFDTDGNFQTEWKHVGSPWGLAFAPDGNLLMADGWNDRVLKLDLDGKILGVLGGPGRMPGQFRFVHHLSVGLRGELYVGEIIHMRPQKFLPR
jgi:DNA-binding beta-propeller fold protein YncE